MANDDGTDGGFLNSAETLSPTEESNIPRSRSESSFSQYTTSIGGWTPVQNLDNKSKSPFKISGSDVDTVQPLGHMTSNATYQRLQQKSHRRGKIHSSGYESDSIIAHSHRQPNSKKQSTSNGYSSDGDNLRVRRSQTGRAYESDNDERNNYDFVNNNNLKLNNKTGFRPVHKYDSKTEEHVYQRETPKPVNNNIIYKTGPASGYEYDDRRQFSDGNNIRINKHKRPVSGYESDLAGGRSRWWEEEQRGRRTQRSTGYESDTGVQSRKQREQIVSYTTLQSMQQSPSHYNEAFSPINQLVPNNTNYNTHYSQQETRSQERNYPPNNSSHIEGIRNGDDSMWKSQLYAASVKLQKSPAMVGFFVQQ